MNFENTSTLILFPADYDSKDALYSALIRLWDLPDWCGRNADALHDCLSELPETVRLVIRGEIPEAIANDLAVVCQVVEDADGEVIRG